MTKAEKIIQDIKDHPENHKHDFSGLNRCCIIDGVMDCSVMEAHQELMKGEFKTSRCDVTRGPCACGAWH
jgi:hypothetical protein